jgi:hypothetical protein
MGVFQISKQGYDLHTAQEKDFIFSDQFVSPKIFKKDSQSFFAPEYKTVQHGLGYRPNFHVFLKRGADPSSNASPGWEAGSWRAYTTTQDLVLYGEAGDRERYFILYDPSDAVNEGVDTNVKNSRLIIAKEGIDITTAKAHELSFNAAWDTFLIVNTFTIPLQASSIGLDEVKIPHDLGYTPAFVACFKTGIYLDTTPYFADLSPYYLTVNVRVDKKNIYLYRETNYPDADPSFHIFKVHLFNEELI